MAAVDHLVYACPDLAEGVRRVEGLLGVEPSEGGRHEGRGTRNALVRLGPDSYLEIVGVDPEQPDPDAPRWFGLDRSTSPALRTWAAKTDDLPRVAARAEALGVPLGAVLPARRRRPDGTELTWTFTDPLAERIDGLVPFFIDWGGSEHPAGTLPEACTLESLSAAHPDAERVRAVFRALGVDVPVARAPRPRLVARIRSPRGVVVLD